MSDKGIGPSRWGSVEAHSSAGNNERATSSFRGGQGTQQMRSYSPTNSDVSIAESTASMVSAKERLAAFARRRLSEKIRGSSADTTSQRLASSPALTAAASTTSMINTLASNKTPKGFDQRRQERARGAGTYAIQSRNVQFPTLSPGSTSSITSTPRVMRPPVSIAVLQKQRQEERMRRREQQENFPNQSLVAPPERGQASKQANNPTLAGLQSNLSAIEQRKMERVRGSGTHAIEHQRVQFPNLSPASSSILDSSQMPTSDPSFSVRKDATSLQLNRAPLQQSPTSAANRSESPASESSSIVIPNIDHRKNERMRGAATHAIEPQTVQFPNPSPSSSVLHSSQMPTSDPSFSLRKEGISLQPRGPALQQSPSSAAYRSESPASESSSIVIPDIDHRKNERMRGAATHAIAPQRVHFPNPSPTSSSILDSSQMPNSDPSFSVHKDATLQPNRPPLQQLPASDRSIFVPNIDQRENERVRGAPIHAIEPQQVQFQNQSPSSSSTLGRMEGPISEPSEIVPDIEKRRQERVRSAGVHPVQSRTVGFPEQSPASSIAAPSFSSLVSTPAIGERPKGIEERRQERARGAGTHAIEPQQVQFQNQSPSTSSVLDRTEGPISEPSVIVPDIESRRQERVRGAGVYPVQARTVGFPEQSPASTTMMNDTSNFDISFLDPALLDTNNGFGEYQYVQAEGDIMMEEDDDVTLQPEEDQTMVEEPQQRTRKGKRKRPSKEKEADFSRETSAATEGSISKSKARKRLRPPGDFDPQLRKAINKPLPLWHNPKTRLTNDEKTEAQVQLADVMDLCIRESGFHREGDFPVSRKTVGPSDADVIYTLIKREFQKVAKTIHKQKRPFLSELLDELVVHFRELSKKYTTRQQLIRDLRLVQEKRATMRKKVHEQRRNNVEALRSIDGLKQQQERITVKAKNDRKIASFLTDMREKYAPLWN